MQSSDPISDLLTRIRNGQMRGLRTISCPASNFKGKILQTLKHEGYIQDYKREEPEPKKVSFSVTLRYYEGSPVIKEVSRVSKPGRRVYVKVSDIPRMRNGLGAYVLSTPQGLMSDAQARRNRVGGEILFRIF